LSGIMGLMESRKQLESVVQAVEDVRADLLQYTPPWVEPEFETLRIALDRKLRSVQLAIAALKVEAASPLPS
jgi:hypothetical protein